MLPQLLDETEIIDRSFDRSRIRTAAIYFLIDGDHVVYVGRSDVVFSRLANHHRARRMNFDRITVVFCRQEETAELEAAYILALRPAYNVSRGTKKARKKSLPDSTKVTRLMLTTDEAVDYLERRYVAITAHALSALRHAPDGPRSVRIGRRTWYNRDELESWAANNLRTKNTAAA